MSLAAGATDGRFTGWGVAPYAGEPQQEYQGQGGGQFAQTPQWVADALDAIAERAHLIDVAATGESDGVASSQDLRSALASGLFDGDVRKLSVERLVAFPESVRQTLGDAALDEQGELRLALADLSAGRPSQDTAAATSPGAGASADTSLGQALVQHASAQQGEPTAMWSAWSTLPSQMQHGPASAAAVQSASVTESVASGQGAATTAGAAPADARPAFLNGADAVVPGVSSSEFAFASSLDDAQRMRQVLVANFGFLDAAGLDAEIDRSLPPEDRPDGEEKAESARDGRFNMDDLAAAARSEFLEATDVQALARLASDKALFDKLDVRDGEADGRITYSALWKAADSTEEELELAKRAGDVPSVGQANYNERFFELQQQMEGKVWNPDGVTALSAGPDAVLSADGAVANALDALDGKADMSVNGDGLKLYGDDTKEHLFAAPANDGSGSTVLSAAIKAMVDDFKEAPRPELPGDLNKDRPRAYRLALALWDNLSQIGATGKASDDDLTITRADVYAAIESGKLSARDEASLSELRNDDQAWDWLSSLGGGQPGDGIAVSGMRKLVTDFNKANFNGIIMAAGAVRSGIPMKTSQFSGATFPEDMSADFSSSKIFDPAIAEAAYSRLMSDPEIQKMLAGKIRQFTENASSRAKDLFLEISSQHYFDSLSYVEKLPDGEALSQEKVSADLAALATLDPGLAEEASVILLQRRLQGELSEATPSSVPTEQVLLATRDFLTALTFDLRTARGLFRLPGLIAGHDAGWKQIGSLLTSWPAEKLSQVSDTLSKVLIRADSASSINGMPPTAQAVYDILDSDVGKAKAELGAATTAAERSRLQGVLDGATKRSKDLKDLVAAAERNGVWASIAGGISLASGVYKLVKGGENLKGDSWGRLSIANDFVLATCFTPGYISQANYWMGRLGHGWNMSSIGMGPSPSQTFGNLVRAFQQGDFAAVAASRAGTALGIALKGLTGTSLLAAGTIGGAMGIKQIVDAIGKGDESEIAAGSLNVAMGASWTASGVAYLLGSAMTGPLIGIGAAFGVVAVLISIFGHKPDNEFADAFEDRLGAFAESGVLREGWRDSAKDWFNDNQKKTEGSSGLGLDL